MIPQSMASAHALAATETQQWQFRYGCVAARIGAEFSIKTTVALATNKGVLRAGQSVQIGVRDLATASPEARAVLRWVCKHPSCRSQHWESKEELIADPEHRPAALHADQQTHVFFAVAEVTHVPGVPAKRDAAGEVIEPAIPPAGFVEIYSDEA